MATKKRVKSAKKKPVRPTIRDDGSITVTLTFPMPVAIRFVERMMENLTTPQAVQFLNEIVRDKENRKAARKKTPKGKPDSKLN